MKRFVQSKRVASRRLPLALLYLASVSAFAQNAREIEAMRKKTDVKGLQVFSQLLKKTLPSVETLKTKAEKLKIPFLGEFNGRYYQLKTFDENGLPLYYTTYNKGAAQGTNTHQLHSSAGIFNLDGAGMIIHEWDGGAVLTTHQEFGGRAMQKDKPYQSSDHATHVAGTLIASGVDRNAQGMAPKASLHAYDWTDDEKEMVAAATSALVSNHSYGFTLGFSYTDASGNTGWHWYGDDADVEEPKFGKYGTNDQEWDYISYKAPYYLPVKAAGNPRGDGPKPGGLHYVRVKENGKIVWKESTKVRQVNGGESGYDCISTASVGKNVLVVAAAHKIEGGYQSAADVRAASFSAFGPTDDGRIKPDIAGVGVNVYSATSSGNKDYTVMSGTSMASPNVTGSLALLQEHYKKLNYGTEEHPFMKAATLKALVIHTANEAGDAPGPDYKFGWGLLDTFKAAQTLAQRDKYSFIKEEVLSNGTSYTTEVVASGETPLVVTIAWDDPAQATAELTSGRNLNDRKRMLVNDLDIRVSDGSNEFLPWVLNPETPEAPATYGDNIRDNVEQIYIPNPVAGTKYTITVSHKGQLKTNEITKGTYLDTVGLVDAQEQAFSMVVTGINNNVNKDLAVLNIALPKAIEYTEHTPINIKVENKGESVSGATLICKVSYQNPKTKQIEIVDTKTVVLPRLNKGERTTQQVNVDLSRGFVDYSITAEVIAEGDEIPSNNKVLSSAFGIIADLTKENSQHSFGFEEDFSKYGWTAQDVDKDGRTWRKYDKADFAKTGRSFAVNFPGLKTGTNDWLFSNPLKLKANTKYRVVLSTRKLRNNTEKLELAIGDQPIASAMTTKIGSTIEATKEYVRYIYDFTPTKDGLQYIGFKNASPDEDSYAIFLDDVSIQYALSTPMVDFSISKTEVNTFETVELNAEAIVDSSLPVTKQSWSFSPNTITYVEEKDTASTKVIFNQEGTYDITYTATNAKGEGVEAKQAVVVARNTPVYANFGIDRKIIYQSDFVTLRNASTGNPAPTEFKWTITPNDGVEFVNGTKDSSENPQIKFKKIGKYSIKLEVTSRVNTDTFEAKELVEVLSAYDSVHNLKGSFDSETQKVNLSWERPILLPIFSEGFDSKRELPKGISVIDEDKDGKTWAPMLVPNSVITGTSSVYASYNSGGDASNWMFTEKLRKGAEVVSFNTQNIYSDKERLDVYIVPAKADGQVPTLEEIKAGQKVLEKLYTNRTAEKTTIDISAYTATDNYLVFHHKTNKVDNGFWFVLDDLEVGYKNATVATTAKETHLRQEREIPTKSKMPTYADKNTTLEPDYRRELEEENIALHKSIEKSPVTLGVISAPSLVGYEIYKDGVKITPTSLGINDLSYQDSVSTNKTYTYDVYTVYSNGDRGEKASVTVDVSTLSTQEISTVGLKIYPNPSDGKFIIELGENVITTGAQVYDLSGRLILSQQYKGNRIELDLTKSPKGVYVLKLVDNLGNTHTAKLLVK